jgi:hypothetical protein
MRQCISCWFFKPDPDHDEDRAKGDMGNGECRRHAPQIITARDYRSDEVEEALTEWRWPITADEEWCGEFEPKP